MEHYCQGKKVPCNPFDPTRVAPFKELTRKSNALGIPPEQLKAKFLLPKKQSIQERKLSQQIETKYSQGCQTIEQQNAFYFTQYAANDICRKDKECAIYSFMEYVLNATFHPKSPAVTKGKPKKKKCDHANESETCKTCEKVVNSIVQTIFKDQFRVPNISPLAEMEHSKHVIHRSVSNKCLQTGDRRPLKSAMNRKLNTFANNFPPEHSEQQTNLYNVPQTELEHQENLLDYISKTINGLTNDHDKEKKTLDELKEENLKFLYNMKVNDELEQKMKCRSEQSRSYISQAGSKETYLTCYSCIPDSTFTNQEFNPPSTFSNYPNKMQNTMYQSTLCNECNWKHHNYIGNQSKKQYNRGSEYYGEHNGLLSGHNTNEGPKSRRICSHKSFGQHCSKHSNYTNYEPTNNRMSGKKTGEQPMNSHDYTVLFRNHIDYFPQTKKQVDYNKEGMKYSESESNFSPNHYSSQDHPLIHHDVRANTGLPNDFTFKNRVNNIPLLLKNIIGAPRKLGELKSTCTQTNEQKNYDNNTQVNVPVNNENNLRTSLENIVNHLVSDKNLEELFKERLTVYFKDLIKIRLNENETSLTDHHIDETPVLTQNPLQENSHVNSELRKYSNDSNFEHKCIKADQCTQSEKRDSIIVLDFNDDFQIKSPIMGCCNVSAQNECLENSAGLRKNFHSSTGKTKSTSKSKGFSKPNIIKSKYNQEKMRLPDEVQNIIRKKTKITPIRETAIYTEQTELDTNIRDPMKYLKSLQKQNENKEKISQQKPVDAIPTGNTTNLLTFYEKKINKQSNAESQAENQSKEEIHNELDNHTGVPREELLTFLDIFQSFTKLVPNHNIFSNNRTLFQINIIADKAEQLLQRIFEASMRLKPSSIHYNKELKEKEDSEESTVQTDFKSITHKKINTTFSENLLPEHSQPTSPVSTPTSSSPQTLPTKSMLPARCFLLSKSEPSLKKKNSLAVLVDSTEHKLKYTEISQTYTKLAELKKARNVSKSKKKFIPISGKENKPLMLIHKLQQKNIMARTDLLSLTALKNKKYRHNLKKVLTDKVNKDSQQNGNQALLIKVKKAHKHFKKMFNKYLNLINESDSKSTQINSEESQNHLRALKSGDNEFRDVFPSKINRASSRIRLPPLITLPFSSSKYQKLEYFTCENDSKVAEIMNKHQDYLGAKDLSNSNINIKNYILCDIPEEKKCFENDILPDFSMLNCLKGKIIFSQESKSKGKIEEWISNNININSEIESVVSDDSLISQEELSESKFFSIPSFRTDSNNAYVFYTCSEDESTRSPSINFFEQLKSQKEHELLKRKINFTILSDHKKETSNESDSSRSYKSREFYLQNTTQITHKLCDYRHAKEKNIIKQKKKDSNKKFQNSSKIPPRNSIMKYEWEESSMEMVKKAHSYKRKCNTNLDCTSFVNKNSSTFRSSNKLRDEFYLKFCSNQDKSNTMDTKIHFVSKNSNTHSSRNDNYFEPTFKTLPKFAKRKSHKLSPTQKLRKMFHSKVYSDNKNTKIDKMLVFKDHLEQQGKPINAESKIKDESNKSLLDDIDECNKQHFSPNTFKDYFKGTIENNLSVNSNCVQNNNYYYTQENKPAESTIEEKVHRNRVELFKNRVVILKEVLDKLDDAVFVYRKIDTILKEFSCKMSQPLASSLGNTEKKCIQ